MRCIALALVAAALLPAAAVAAKPPLPEKGLRIYWVDVEGGAATLMVTPAGQSVLVDAGNPGARDPKRIHEVATKVAGLTKIDHMVVTHLHSDHFGGVADLAALMPIGTLWESPIDAAPERERNDAKVAAYRAAKVGARLVIEPGTRLPLEQTAGAPPVRITFLAARQKLMDANRTRKNDKACAGAAPRDEDRSDNANSVVLRVEYGRFKFFDGGDLTWNVEEKLVCPFDRVGRVDVFQVNHHGLDVSNNPVLVATLQPTVAIVNNGPRKGGQPQTFATLKATRTLQAIYQVHRNLVAPEANTDAKLIANEADPCGASHIELSVDPDGRAYTVSIPSTGHSKKYKTRS